MNQAGRSELRSISSPSDCRPKAGERPVSESQLPPDRRSDEELKSSLRKGNLGERRKAFLQEILRRRDEAKAAGRSRMYLWLAAIIGVFSVGIAALTRRK
jgi:hypothetical protein